MTKKSAKKLLLVFLAIVTAFSLSFSLAACGNGNSDSGQTDGQTDGSNTDDGDTTHTHTLIKTEAKTATCAEDGNIEYWYCSECGKYFADSEAETEISLESIVVTANHTYSGNWTCTVCGQTLTESAGLEYTLSDNGDSYTVSGIGECADTDIVIPYAYNNLPVTAIGDGAFYTSYTSNNNSITSVSVPDSVTSIGNSAFTYSSIESVTIGNGVTTIGNQAFYGCTTLKNVTLGSGITEIGYSAFNNCWALESVTIPDSITSIGDYAFSGCNSLKSIKLGSGLTSIGYLAFANCYNLESLTIPASVTEMGNNYYQNCIFDLCVALKSIEVEEGNTVYKSIDGNLYSYDGTKLISYATGKTNSSFAVPDGVTEIGISAFKYAYPLQYIELPASLTTINNEAFKYCGLISVEIPEGVTTIGYSAFANCPYLISASIPSTVTGNTYGESTIYGIFDDCNKLIEVYVLTSSSVEFMPNNMDIYEEWYYIESIYGGYFQYCAKIIITSASAESHLIYQDDYIFFKYNGGYYLAGYTGEDTELTLPELTVNGEQVSYAIYNYAFGTDNTSYNTLSYLAENGIKSTTFNITSIVIPDCVTEIGESAFMYCLALESVTIGNGVTSIGSMAFSYCTCEIIWGDNPAITEIGNAAFMCYDGTSITIPASVTKIGIMAFGRCNSLESIVFEDTNSWFRAESSDATSGTSIDVSDASKNVTYLTSDYSYYYLIKK